MGSSKIIKQIKKIVRKKNFFYIKNLGSYYYSFLQKCIFLIGNSSSGVTDTVLLNVNTINIGERQKGRTMPDNVINADHRKISVQKAIYKLLNKKAANLEDPSLLN